MAHHISQLDTTVEIVTPENIAFRYQVAGPFRRLPAYGIDLLLRTAVLVLVSLVVEVMVSGGLGDIGYFLLLVASFVLAWFYGVLFETYFNGKTPGKWLLGLRVVSVEGRPLTGAEATLRNLLRGADMAVFPVALLVTAGTRRFQRLGDLAAGTMVVVEEGRWFQGLMRIRDAEVLRLANSVPADFRASPSLARALAIYVQRRLFFSWQRRAELARILAVPLRDKLHQPKDTNLDLLLCGLYYRTFVTDQPQDPSLREGRRSVRDQSPFVRFEDLLPPEENDDRKEDVVSTV